MAENHNKKPIGNKNFKKDRLHFKRAPRTQPYPENTIFVNSKSSLKVI